MACWRESMLGDLLTIKHGYALKGEYFANAGTHIVLTPGNFLDEGGFKYKESKEKWYMGPIPSEFVLEEGDLIVVMTEQAEGLLGSSALVPRSNLYLHNQRLGLVQIRDESATDKRFLYYLFNSKHVRQQIRATANGAKVRHTSPSRIAEVKVRVPLFDAQRKIAAILSAYDDLIENNTRRIKILEEMARLTYREWFVNFCFPGHEKVKMVNSRLGKVPEGWQAKKLGDVCDIMMGQSPASEFYKEIGEGLPFHQGVTDFTDRFPIDRVYCTVQNRIAEADDILFSVRAPVGRINLANKKIVIGRGLCAIRSKTGNQIFLFHQLKDKFQKEDTMGGGTIFKSVTKDDMLGILILIPSQTQVEGFEKIVAPIFHNLEILTVKNANLRRTRDLLLPKLISGEVDVEDLDINTGGLPV